LTVDGRDFLYTLIPFACASDRLVPPLTLRLLQEAFGEIIAEYIGAGRMLASKAEEERSLFRFWRLTDHAAMDRRVIRAQLSSRITIQGRYGTRFRSAFGVVEAHIPHISRTISRPFWFGG
jgi:hypothetical protein